MYWSLMISDVKVKISGTNFIQIHWKYYKTELNKLIKAMNGLFSQYGPPIHYVHNPLSGYIQQQQPCVIRPSSYGLAQHQLNTGLTLASLPPQQQLLLRAQLQGLGRVLMQQQFCQNYSFANSDFYHQIPNIIGSNYQSLQCSQVEPSNPVPLNHSACVDIKSEILKQLASVETRCKTPEKLCSSELQADETHKEEEEDSSLALSSSKDDCGASSIIEPRGMKRHLDWFQSPHKKKNRPDSKNGGTKQNRTFWPGPNPKKELDDITQTIWRHFENRHQTDETYRRKMELREALYSVVKGVFPYCGLYVVGSSMNGFGSQMSDMDMCLMISQAHIDQKKEATEILRCLLKALRKCSFLTNLMLIRAKVPILKCTDRVSGVEIDLNINNPVGIHNTHLLNAYSRLDWRVSPLVLFTKHWACQQNIKDASQGTISSYSIVLMVIHYLQCGCKPAVLPSLQQIYPNKFSATTDVRLLTLNEKLPEYISKNTMSLGELFIGFLHYYAVEFDFEKHAISVRLGRKVARHVVESQTPNNTNQWKCLCIEEPFDLSNASRSVYDQHVFARCRRVIRASLGQLRKTGDIHSILNQPV